MINVTGQDGAQYTFGARTNAKAIIIYLAYYKHGDVSWSFTDAWAKLKRDDISVPCDVQEEAFKKASELMILG